MNPRIQIIIGILVLCSAFFYAPPAMADKAAVTIEAPAEAAKGSEITIRVTVTHNGNSARHYVEWVKIFVNNKEIAKWEYASSKLPEALPFTREIKYKAEATMEIKAEASCNVHGSKGPTTAKSTVK